MADAVSAGCSKWGTWPQFSIHFNSLHLGSCSTNLNAVDGSKISSFLPHIRRVSCCTNGTLGDTGREIIILVRLRFKTDQLKRQFSCQRILNLPIPNRSEENLEWLVHVLINPPLSRKATDVSSQVSNKQCNRPISIASHVAKDCVHFIMCCWRYCYCSERHTKTVSKKSNRHPEQHAGATECLWQIVTSEQLQSMIFSYWSDVIENERLREWNVTFIAHKLILSNINPFSAGASKWMTSWNTWFEFNSSRRLLKSLYQNKEISR